MQPGFKDSMVAGNGYMFHCPTVDRDALFTACAFKRHKHWRGDDFADQDCRCAMRGGKCPAVRMLQKEWREEQRFYHSAEPTMHKLPRDIFDQIERIILFPFHARGLNLTPEQSAKLFGRTLDATNVAETPEQPADGGKPSRIKQPRATARKSRASTEQDILAGAAAANTDMASLLNQSMQGSEE